VPEGTPQRVLANSKRAPTTKGNRSIHPVFAPCPLRAPPRKKEHHFCHALTTPRPCHLGCICLQRQRRELRKPKAKRTREALGMRPTESQKPQRGEL